MVVSWKKPVLPDLPLFDLFLSQSILSGLLPVLDRLLLQTEQDSSYLLQAETQLLQLILRKYNPESAPLLARDPKSLDLFTKALRLPSCQIPALEQVG